jgi:hypothetical protein
MRNALSTPAEPTINRDLAAAYILFRRGMRSCFYLDFQSLWDLNIDKAVPFAVEYGRALLFSSTQDIRRAPLSFDELRTGLYKALRDVLADLRRRCNSNRYELPGFREHELSDRVAPALETQIEDWLLESLGALASSQQVDPARPDRGTDTPPALAARIGTATPRSERLCRSDDEAERAQTRSKWVNQKRIDKGWNADTEIVAAKGPTYNTIRRYRSGKRSTRDYYVRLGLAKAFGCEVSDVPK